MKKILFFLVLLPSLVLAQAMSKDDAKTKVEQNVLTGGRKTTAEGLREVFYSIIDSYQDSMFATTPLLINSGTISIATNPTFNGTVTVPAITTTVITVNGTSVLPTTINAGSNITVVGSYPSFTVSTTGLQGSLTAVSPLSITTNTISISTTPTFTTVTTNTLTSPVGTFTTLNTTYLKVNSYSVTPTANATISGVNTGDQTLSISTNTLSISGGNSIVVPTTSLIAGSNISLTSGTNTYTIATSLTPTFTSINTSTLTSPVVTATNVTTTSLTLNGATANTFAGFDANKQLTSGSLTGAGTLTITGTAPNYTLTGGGGALTNWVENVSTSAPNATIPAVSFTVTNASSNVDAVLMPKGTGANLAQIPNNSTSGGNKRGAYATDWAKSRSINSQVASGDYSTITGGLDNTASGIYSTTGGYNCTSSGTASTAFGVSSNASGSRAVALGGSNTSSGTSSVALGQENNISGDQAVGVGYQNVGAGQYGFSAGVTNTANGYGAQAMGSSNTSSGTYSHVHGANGNAYSTRYRYVHSSGEITTQMSRFIVVATTTGTVATVATTDNSGVANTSNIINLQNYSLYAFTGYVVGKIQNGNHGVWKVEGVVERGANAASTAVTVSTITLVSNTGSLTTPTLTADATNGGMLITVAGLASTNIKWTAIIETTEIVY